MGFLNVAMREGVDPGKLIVAHCDSIEDVNCHMEIARTGAWIEYDGVSETSSERDLKLIEVLLKNGFEDRLLLSQDAGWYNVGEPRGGNIRKYPFC